MLLLKHPLQLSTLLQEYITNICSCGNITVTITVTSCTDQTVMYSIWLTGVMATEAALLMITNIQNLIEGLDLGIVTLFLQEDGTHLESNCDDQQITVQSDINCHYHTKCHYSNVVVNFALDFCCILEVINNLGASVLASYYGIVFAVLAGKR